jgi:hypothetical protein
MKAQSLALATFALIFGFGFAATSSVQAGPNQQHLGNSNSQIHMSPSQPVTTTTAKHASRDPETKDYLVITLQEADIKKTHHKIQTSSPHRAH